MNEHSSSVAPSAAAAAKAPDATLRSTPDTVVWGYLTSDAPPVLTVKSGQTVRIDTISQAGLTTADDPVTFYGRGGIAASGVLKDMSEIYREVRRPKDAGAHVLTGPIYDRGRGAGRHARGAHPRAARALRRQQTTAARASCPTCTRSRIRR